MALGEEEQALQVLAERAGKARRPRRDRLGPQRAGTGRRGPRGRAKLAEFEQPRWPPTRTTTPRASTWPSALNANEDRAGAVDALLEAIRRDRAWNEEAARKQLLKFFEAWGFDDPATLAGRRKLSSLLFR